MQLSAVMDPKGPIPEVAGWSRAPGHGEHMPEVTPREPPHRQCMWPAPRLLRHAEYKPVSGERKGGNPTLVRRGSAAFSLLIKRPRGCRMPRAACPPGQTALDLPVPAITSSGLAQRVCGRNRAFLPGGWDIRTIKRRPQAQSPLVGPSSHRS